MTKIKTIEHEYGTEKIEVAECASCGQTTKEEQMREYRIYNKTGDDFISGCICPHCRDLENPVDHPSIEGQLYERVPDLLAITVIVCFILIVLFISLGLLRKIIGLIVG